MRLANGKTSEQVLRFLQGVEFPVKKDDLVHIARNNGAPADVIGALGQLPATEFANEDELIEAYPHME
jgi:hypothetical protein